MGRGVLLPLVLLACGCNDIVGFSDLEKSNVNAPGSGAPLQGDDILLTVIGRHGSCVTMAADGATFCWGQQTGNRERPSSPTPVAVEGIVGATSVVLGHHHRCVLTPEDGAVYCWGDNDHGQLGNGSLVSSLVPVQVPDLPPAERISASGNHTCITTPEEPARAFCWGDNSFGQLGMGDTIDRPSPVEITGLDEPIRVACGEEYTCSVSANGNLRCWGRNDRGQLGLEPSENPFVMTPTLVGGPALERIYPAAKHTCGRTQGDRRLVCWGDNSWGQLGDGTTTSRHTPAIVDAVDETLVGYPGQRHTCAATTSEAVFCFGANDFGQLGQPASDAPVASPLVLTENVGQMACKTAEHTCFSVKGGPLTCMGLNANGQLGDGTYENRDAPTVVTF